MPALNPAVLENACGLDSRSAKELRELGRLPYPMVRRRDPGFCRITWEEALNIAAGRIRAAIEKGKEKGKERNPASSSLAFYLTSRGIPNETYYVAQ